MGRAKNPEAKTFCWWTSLPVLKMLDELCTSSGDLSKARTLNRLVEQEHNRVFSDATAARSSAR